nr:fluoride efflux transporter CrcB [Sedimentibacter sp.]
MEYLLAAIGGALGGLTRFTVGIRISERSHSNIPVGTFIINVTGAIFLGIFSSIGLNEKMYALIGDGFLGAYTTFSTFMYEGFELFQDNEKMNASIYILGSLVLGVIGYFTGTEIAKLIQII